ncbi:hypothetical protein N7452_007267 [Penicillium brevicompactum]|uniref:DJ-1/PfpI domain-containing protein n=1 Tax=Penicillium brevicompactum TaxID=5074 RepID=A0A9W9QEZ6_PENBR|nr:hypothetical protein N7452_007267 [Penicillium brevicompactum]
MSDLRIGVLLIGTPQLLDLSPIDLFWMTTPSYLTECSAPAPLQAQSRPCEIHYIGATLAPAPVTANMTILPTNAISDSAVAPGKLDVLMIPGRAPGAGSPDDEYLDFVRAHNAAGTSILSICTGAYAIGYSGIADGRTVTGPRLLVPELKDKFPDANWLGELRVIRDENLWSCGGITNGHDLVAAYLRENYPAPLVNFVLALADVTERPKAYADAMAVDFGFMLWQVIKAVPNYLLKKLGL